MPDLRDQVQRRAVRGQMRLRAQARRRSRSRWCRRAAASSSARSTSSSSRSRIRSRNRNALAIRTPPAPCCIPATGRSIRPRSSAPPTDERRLRELGDEGVLALIGDSTNAVREGRSPVRDRGRARPSPNWSRRAKGRVAVTTFASNVARLRAVADAAQACRPRGRAWSAAPWSGWSQVARETGYLDGVPNFRGADALRPSPAATRCWRCAPAARASRARRWRASPMTIIRR